MPANTLPIVPNVPTAECAASVANVTARTQISGTGTTTSLTAATTNGKRVDQIVVQCIATSAAAIVFIWIYDGTNQNLFDEIVIPAVTVSNTVAGARIEKNYSNLVLPAAHRLFASTTINQATDVFALGGNY